MDNQDKKPFLELIRSTGETYGREISVNVASLYFNVLQDKTIEQVKQAIALHMRDTDVGQFMPKPADILRNIKGDIQPKIENKGNLEWCENTQSLMDKYGDEVKEQEHG